MFQQYDEMEAIKKTIEKRLGISYEEFMSMDFSEQLKPLYLRRNKKKTFKNIFSFNGIISPEEEMNAINNYNKSKSLVKKLNR